MQTLQMYIQWATDLGNDSITRFEYLAGVLVPRAECPLHINTHNDHMNTIQVYSHDRYDP